MGILNENVTVSQLSAADRACFIGTITPHLFPKGWELYKFTEYPLTGTSVSPWWSSVRPAAASDPGLAGTLERAKRLKVDPQRFARVRSAVTKQWNGMDRLQTVRLMVPVYGFVGRCSAQRIDKSLAENVVFIGGAWQVFIPGLARTDVMEF